MNEETPDPVTPPSFPLSFGWRILYGAFVVIMPFIDFKFVEVFQTDWQSGELSDYIAIFLSPNASLLFFPLLAYSVISYILFLWDETRYAGKFIIRFGIYAGVLLALQYSILSFLAFSTNLFSGFILTLAWLTPFLINRLYLWFTSKWSMGLFRNIVLGIVFVAFVISSIYMDDILSPLFLALLIVGVAAPFWSFFIAGQAALWLFKHHESKYTLLRGLGGVAWVSTYIYAMRFNILKMYELYAALPPQPPDCYIATAAAQGHSRIVRSQTVCLSNGKQMQVNQQLQRLKCVELALMVTAPNLHKLIRRIYDVIGKRLAAYIQNPILADVAFLLLIPVEWISFFVLKLTIPNIQAIAKKMYHS